VQQRGSSSRASEFIYVKKLWLSLLSYLRCNLNLKQRIRLLNLREVVVESIEDEYCTDSWEQVSYPDKQVYEIALGSGADVSVMPFDWASLG